MASTDKETQITTGCFDTVMKLHHCKISNCDVKSAVAI